MPPHHFHYPRVVPVVPGPTAHGREGERADGEQPRRRRPSQTARPATRKPPKKR